MRARIANETRDWIGKTMKQQCNLAVTLTVDGNKFEALRKLSRQDVDTIMSKELAYAKNKLNDKIFGNNWRRKQQGVKMVAIRELKNRQPHYHIALAVPQQISLHKAFETIEGVWKNTRFGGKHNKAELITNEFDWNQYITKHITENDTDGIDVRNIHF